MGIKKQVEASNREIKKHIHNAVHSIVNKSITKLIYEHLADAKNNINTLVVKSIKSNIESVVRQKFIDGNTFASLLDNAWAEVIIARAVRSYLEGTEIHVSVALNKK